jgi:[acyl-carrier-protein] S-malonyltransferase
MASAVEALREFAGTLVTSDPVLPIWTNRDGSRATSGKAFLDLLVGQVSSPVRWDRTMQSFSEAGITGLIEVVPAGALTGLARRGLPGVPTVAIKTPDDLSAAIEMLENR